MNIQSATCILNIPYNYSESELKTQYKSLARKYHPDKNTYDSTRQFQEINEAYLFLLNNKYAKDTDPYDQLFNIFIQTVCNSAYTQIIHKIVNCQYPITTSLFSGFTSDHLNTIYNLIEVYKDDLYISEDVLNSVRNIINEKMKTKVDQIKPFIIRPSLYDLLNNNIHKFSLDDCEYNIPLWHKSVEFLDKQNHTLVIQCTPVLPDNVEIDADNNLLVHYDVPFNLSLLSPNTKYIPIVLENKVLEIPIGELNILPVQQYTFKNQGVLRVSKKNMYDESNIGDIVVQITFTTPH